jgi:hypothetical protein
MAGKGLTGMKITKAKAWAATAGGIGTFLVEIAGFLADGKLDGAELATAGGSLVTLVSTVYAVWRVTNKPTA